ncbi:MAG: hypothetical protein ACO1O6_01125 [Bacteroidota bacterium]
MKQDSNEAGREENEDQEFPGYPHYPDQEDIYRQEKEEQEIDPEDPAKIKSPNETYVGRNEKNSDSVLPGNDLDVPGSELDDALEDVGSEDEENNYYSLGGDDKNLDENRD